MPKCAIKGAFAYLETPNKKHPLKTTICNYFTNVTLEKDIWAHFLQKEGDKYYGVYYLDGKTEPKVQFI
jgi:hypothetical protein